MCKSGRLKKLYSHDSMNAIPKWMFNMEAFEILTDLAEYDMDGNPIKER